MRVRVSLVVCDWGGGWSVTRRGWQLAARLRDTERHGRGGKRVATAYAASSFGRKRGRKAEA